MKNSDFNNLIQTSELEVYIKIEDRLQRVNFEKELFDFSRDSCCIDLVRKIKIVTEAITQDWRQQ